MATTRIGVLSDTHGNLPQAAFEVLNGDWDAPRLSAAVAQQALCSYGPDGALAVEQPAQPQPLESMPCGLVLHAGDILKQADLDTLGAIVRTVAVLGNNDFDRLWDSDGEVRALRSLSFGGVAIAMAHIPKDLHAALYGRPPLQPKAIKVEPDLAICGHTHVPLLQLEGNHLLLNPGSPSHGRNGSGHNLALVDVEDGHLKMASIIRI